MTEGRRTRSEESALGLLSERLLETARAGYEAMSELIELHRAAEAGSDARGRWEQLTGARAIRERLDRLRDLATESIRTLVKPPIVLPPPDGEQHRRLAERGVRYRLLYDRDVFEADPIGDQIRLSIDRGDEVRFAGRLPLKLMIVDGRTVVIEDPGAHRPQAVVTAQGSVVELAAALFEQLWAASVPAPVRGAEKAPISEDDSLLLSLLIAGLTDQSIASKLGIGLRTVQRRVRDLMDLAEVDTRIQLGWHAARNDWVSLGAEPDPPQGQLMLPFARRSHRQAVIHACLAAFAIGSDASVRTRVARRVARWSSRSSTRQAPFRPNARGDPPMRTIRRTRLSPVRARRSAGPGSGSAEPGPVFPFRRAGTPPVRLRPVPRPGFPG